MQFGRPIVWTVGLPLSTGWTNGRAMYAPKSLAEQQRADATRQRPRCSKSGASRHWSTVFQCPRLDVHLAARSGVHLAPFSAEASIGTSRNLKADRVLPLNSITLVVAARPRSDCLT